MTLFVSDFCKLFAPSATRYCTNTVYLQLFISFCIKSINKQEKLSWLQYLAVNQSKHPRLSYILSFYVFLNGLDAINLRTN